jgi:thiol peroxidase
MAQTKLGDTTVNTNGNLPAVGNQAPEFTLTGNDLKDVKLSSFRGKFVILNIFPSIDTSTCATSVRQFNKLAATLPDTIVLCIARDLPYAMKRFCGAEGIDKVITLSDFRSDAFRNDYGVMMTEGRMQGLFARAVIVINPEGKITYEELVPTIGQEPNYDAALKAVGFGG